MSALFLRGAKPLGLLLAEGIRMASAVELASKRNWRIRAVVDGLRQAHDLLGETRATRIRGKRTPPPSWYERSVANVVRRIRALEWALRELLKQRARVRRNRGRQFALDWETTMPNWTTDDGESLFGDDRTFAERIGVRNEETRDPEALASAALACVDNPRHSSETFEHGTPPEVVDAARLVLGGIDLDPASCDKANGYIRAVEYMTREDNGFLQPWWGRVFLNPPGGLMELDTGRPVFIKTKKRPPCTESGACGLAPGHVHKNVGSSAAAWWKKLAREYNEGRVTSAVFVGFSLELLQTTQVDAADLPTPLDFPICYPRKRLDYIALEKDGIVPGGAPTHASFVALLPPYGAKNAPDAKVRYAAIVRFRDAFKKFGKAVGS